MLSRLSHSIKRIKGKVILSHQRLLKRLCGELPISLWYWVVFRSFMGLFTSKPDPICPPEGLFRTIGRSLSIPDLKDLLADDLLGEWALDADSLSLLWRVLWKEKPKMIFEFGSGVSTVVLAHYAVQVSLQGNDCFVVSIEQNQEVRVNVEARLTKSGLGKGVKIICVPLDNEGSYCLKDLHEVQRSLSDKWADLIFIDGPKGPPGCRFGTVPMSLQYCRDGARWLMHDAFRDGELSILRRWQHLPGITVEGIYPVGEGLATGFVRR